VDEMGEKDKWQRINSYKEDIKSKKEILSLLIKLKKIDTAYFHGDIINALI